jgi:hypothetical protein
MSEILEEPIPYSDAIRKKCLKIATEKEIQSVLYNQTWEIMRREEWMRLISARWILNSN